MVFRGSLTFSEIECVYIFPQMLGSVDFTLMLLPPKVGFGLSCRKDLINLT